MTECAAHCDTFAMEGARLDELYGDAILDHRRNPRNYKAIESPDASAKAVNPFCGDEVEIQIAFSDGRVSDVGAQAVGCSINQSTASMLSEVVIGKTPGEILHIAAVFEDMMDGACPSPGDAAAMLELPALRGVREYPVRIKCALLAWSAVEDALDGRGA